MATLSRPLVAFLVPLTSGTMAPLPQAQGVEGRRVESTAAAAFEHLNNRPSRLLEELSDAEPFEYDPVPMQHAFTVKVKYRLVGRMKPLPYPLED